MFESLRKKGFELWNLQHVVIIFQKIHHKKNGRVEPIMELSLGHSLKWYGTQLLLGLQTISTKLRCSHYKWYQSYAPTRNVGLTRDDLYAHKRGRLWMTKEKKQSLWMISLLICKGLFSTLWCSLKFWNFDFHF